MTRALIPLALAALAASACPPPKLGDPLKGLTTEQRDQFNRGRRVFDSVFTPATGLGPLFNADACGECHEDPVSGGAGDEVELHVSAFRPEIPICDPLADKGGPVIQQRVTPALKAALGIDAEPVPAEATGRAARTSPDVFGFGLLDAVTDATLLALADPDDQNGDGISGRVNRFFDGRIGRFGRKALVPTLREFNAGAFQIEQGVTIAAIPDEGTVGGQPIPPGVDPLPEPELRQREVDLTDAFVRFLAPPAPKTISGAAKDGQRLFGEIGCASCHVPTLRTGNHPVKALSGQKVSAYTDLLLHDMGAERADICLALATPSEFRTEPLMGLRHAERFLHDGAAATVEQAIELHGGESAASRDRFKGLSASQRAAVVAFLKAL
ncbi:MAG: di-heme oxidoredictase family protein [Gemmatimonadales bacterium]